MSKLSVLKTDRQQHKDIVLTELTKLHEYASENDVVSMTGIMELSDGSYFHYGSGTISRLRSAGALLEAAINRLNQE